MSRDQIEGFMLGLGAGFLFAHVLKPAEEWTASLRNPTAGIEAARDGQAESAPECERASLPAASLAAVEK